MESLTCNGDPGQYRVDGKTPLPEAVDLGLESGLNELCWRHTSVIARLINEKGLYQRRNKQPVTGKPVYACVMVHPDTFVKREGLIRLMIKGRAVVLKIINNSYISR